MLIKSIRISHNDQTDRTEVCFCRDMQWGKDYTPTPASQKRVNLLLNYDLTLRPSFQKFRAINVKMKDGSVKVYGHEYKGR